MFENLKKNKIEISHELKLIHKKTENSNYGNQAHKDYFFILKINEEYISLDVGNSSVFNHYQIGDIVKVTEIQNFDSSNTLIKKIYRVDTYLELLCNKIKNAYKNKYKVYLIGCNDLETENNKGEQIQFNMRNLKKEEVILSKEFLSDRYRIYKDNKKDTTLVNIYDLYGGYDFADYDFEIAKYKSQSFNGYLSGLDVYIDDLNKEIILTIKDKEMIFWSKIE